MENSGVDQLQVFKETVNTAIKTAMEELDKAQALGQAKQRELKDMKNKYSILQSQFDELQQLSISKDQEIERLRALLTGNQSNLVLENAGSNELLHPISAPIHCGLKKHSSAPSSENAQE